VFDAEQDALRLQDADVGPFQVSTEAIEDGTLFVDSSEQAIYFDSSIHPDLQLGFGDFDRATLPDSTNVVSSFLTEPKFNNDLSEWSTKAYSNIVEYPVGAADRRVKVNSGDNVDIGGTLEVDDNGDGTVEVTKTIQDRLGSEFVIGSTISAGSSVVGNLIVYPTERYVEDPNNGMIEDPSNTTSVKFFSDTANNPTNGIKAEHENSPNYEELICQTVGQNMDFSGNSGNEFTIEIPYEHFTDADGGAFEATISVRKQADGSVVKSKQIAAFSRSSGTDTGVFKLTFTVPTQTALRFQIEGASLAPSTDNNNIDQASHIILEQIRIKDSLFNSVVAADGMLWRDQNNNDQMKFDVNTGEMKVRSFVGVGFNGAGIQVNNNGELEAVDESGNTTVIS